MAKSAREIELEGKIKEAKSQLKLVEQREELEKTLAKQQKETMKIRAKYEKLKAGK